MSMQVSYKKQFILAVMLLIILLVVLETTIKIYDSQKPPCTYINSEVFQNLAPDLQKRICYDELSIKTEPGYLHPVMKPNQHTETFNVNKYGFRGSEITLQKPDNTLRIFVIGGSTILGGASTSDETTISGNLQKKFDDYGLDVQVINAGRNAAFSITEVKYIKDKLIEFEPDLFIVYDGWNDITFFDYQSYTGIKKTYTTNEQISHELKRFFSSYRTAEIFSRFLQHGDIKAPDAVVYPINNEHISEKVKIWKNEWSDICKLGHDLGFDTIITIQPVLGTGTKILTPYEEKYFVRNDNARVVNVLQLYVDELEELKNDCMATVDLRGVFDDISKPIYIDAIHVSDEGNTIVADKLFEKILPIILKDISK